MRLTLFSLILIFGAANAQHAVELAPDSVPNVVIEGDTICDDPGIVGSDDGTAENGYSGNPTTVAEVRLADRFSTADFPGGTIDTVCVGLLTLGPDSINFEIVVFDDDGAGGAPGTVLGTVPASATGLPNGLPPAFYSYDVSGSAIAVPASGDFYIGVQYAPPSPNVFVGADETGGTNAGAGQVFFDTGDPGDDWQALPTVFPSYSALLVRALPGVAVEIPESQPVPTVGTWGLIGLALLLGLVAVTVLRRAGT